MSAIVSGLIGAVVAAMLATIAEKRQRPAQANAEGWKTLRAGWLINATFVASSAFAALMSFILISGGSSRPDAEIQNMYALLLAVAFGFAAFYLAWSSYARIIMWKGNELRVRRTLWRDEVHLISGASSVKRSEALGEYKITFEDGAVLRISAYMHGAKDLLARLPARAQDDQ